VGFGFLDARYLKSIAWYILFLSFLFHVDLTCRADFGFGEDITQGGREIGKSRYEE
jgi:hypothetical protein